ncbi:Acetyl-CoA hydrolase/transferase [Syntrophomonas zehnderi OL-4]|uniref:Acetyl-CoA hydrolase/transferase n=1 Tax=Syntrophomonas zehnderi OL-4 TaxID=690567 RepID=A0A0E3W327_9FIRM|nr:acetyl-CoA hydrolase/transferase C-terminal domain-containing protein [Syntrophomonas zehnderi]CFX43326.1 Acetyl-CoA hydrolase/transferase [Syntrophomonas zehnderi OL-4]
MPPWKNYYQDRIISAQEAVQLIKSNDNIVFGHGLGEPHLLPEAMVKRAQELQNVSIYHMGSWGKGLYTLPEMQGHFIHKSLFVGSSVRLAYSEGRVEYIPCYFSEVPRLFKDGIIPVDIAMVTLTPPDDHGFCSLGISVDYTRQAIKSARIVLAEINPHMPRTYGDTWIKVEEIDYFIECHDPLWEIPMPPFGEIEFEIGRQVAPLVEDGSTLQIGLGTIPDAILEFLADKHDLGMHSEMISDGIPALVNSGVINGCKKTLHKGKIVASFIGGSRPLYEWAHNNPNLELYPVDYVNDPFVIMQNDKMVSINSALQVDLLGQAAADSLGPLQYSGVGGQIDFIRGAARSRGGKSIIALPSTAAQGAKSRIVPTLITGSAVTTSRNDIDYVVTEYGVARLKGKTLRERAKALINIAHPDFQKDLKQDFTSIYGL